MDTTGLFERSQIQASLAAFAFPINNAERNLQVVVVEVISTFQDSGGGSTFGVPSNG